MVREIRIPKMGMNSTEVDIVAIHVRSGDQVDPGSPIADVESEKATVTVEADVSGVVIEVLVSVGDVIPVGTVLCRVEEG